MSLYKHYVEKPPAKTVTSQAPSGVGLAPASRPTGEVKAAKAPVAKVGGAAESPVLGPPFLLQLTTAQELAVEGTRIKLGLKSRSETIRVLLGEALK